MISTPTELKRIASFDGDADRLMYMKRAKSSIERPEVIDGDKQFTLIMAYI